MLIYIYLGVILVTSITLFNIRLVQNKTAYIIKFLWYGLTVLIGLFSIGFTGYNLEDLYPVLLFVIIIIESSDNLRLFSKSKYEK